MARNSRRELGAEFVRREVAPDGLDGWVIVGLGLWIGITCLVLGLWSWFLSIFAIAEAQGEIGQVVGALGREGEVGGAKSPENRRGSPPVAQLGELHVGQHAGTPPQAGELLVEYPSIADARQAARELLRDDRVARVTVALVAPPGFGR